MAGTEPDRDKLRHALAFRRVGERTWRPLQNPGDGALPLTSPEFDWETRFVPGGLYEVRVRVSDDLANPKPPPRPGNLSASPC